MKILTITMVTSFDISYVSLWNYNVEDVLCFRTPVDREYCKMRVECNSKIVDFREICDLKADGSDVC